jgi:uncharacterized cupredoxin-like copper-binding protein
LSAGCAAAPDATATEVRLSEWKFGAPDTTESGLHTWRITNSGLLLHEVLIIATETPDDDLPVLDAMVDVTEIEGELIAEVAEVTPGHTVEAQVSLEPGRYVLICNLAGHYESGMHHVLIVDP